MIKRVDTLTSFGFFFKKNLNQLIIHSPHYLIKLNNNVKYSLSFLRGKFTINNREHIKIYWDKNELKLDL